MMGRLGHIIAAVVVGFLATLGVGLVSGEVVHAANDSSGNPDICSMTASEAHSRYGISNREWKQECENNNSNNSNSGIDTSMPSSVTEAINRLPNANNLSGDFLRTLLNWIYALGGLIAVVMIIYGGIKYNTAQGDPGKVKQAGQIIAFAIVGLVIILLAAAITAFVTGVIGGAA